MVSKMLRRILRATCLVASPIAPLGRWRREPPAAEPLLHHAPVSIARAGAPLAIFASIDHPELVKSAFVVYHVGDDAAVREVPFLRASDGPYVAVDPGRASDARRRSATRWSSSRPAGRAARVFASRAEMQEVEIPGDLEDSRERALSERLGERRSVVTTLGRIRRVRSARRAGRGNRPVLAHRSGVHVSPPSPHRRVRASVPAWCAARTPNPSKPDLGLNYGAPSFRVRLGDIWHVDGEFLTSVTEVGFSVGAGAALLIGDPYGSKLTLGFESIQVFGTRMYSRMDIAASRKLVIAPIVEVTNMPHADRFGVRLLTEARYDAGQGFTFGVLGGYQARVASSGGPALGVNAAYAF